MNNFRKLLTLAAFASFFVLGFVVASSQTRFSDISRIVQSPISSIKVATAACADNVCACADAPPDCNWDWGWQQINGVENGGNGVGYSGVDENTDPKDITPPNSNDSALVNAYNNNFSAYVTAIKTGAATGTMAEQINELNKLGATGTTQTSAGGYDLSGLPQRDDSGFCPVDSYVACGGCLANKCVPKNQKCDDLIEQYCGFSPCYRTGTCQTGCTKDEGRCSGSTLQACVAIDNTTAWQTVATNSTQCPGGTGEGSVTAGYVGGAARGGQGAVCSKDSDCANGTCVANTCQSDGYSGGILPGFSCGGSGCAGGSECVGGVCKLIEYVIDGSGNTVPYGHSENEGNVYASTNQTCPDGEMVCHSCKGSAGGACNDGGGTSNYNSSGASNLGSSVSNCGVVQCDCKGTTGSDLVFNSQIFTSGCSEPAGYTCKNNQCVLASFNTTTGQTTGEYSSLSQCSENCGGVTTEPIIPPGGNYTPPTGGTGGGSEPEPSDNPRTSPSIRPSFSPRASFTPRPSSTPPVRYFCDSRCTTDTQCAQEDDRLKCLDTDEGKRCRLPENPDSPQCQPPVGPQCLSISMNNVTSQENPATADPELGDAINFTCGDVPGAARYIFRVIEPSNTVIDLQATGRTSESYTITQAGQFSAQCQICTGQDASTCHPYESLTGEAVETNNTTDTGGTGGGTTNGRSPNPDASVRPGSTHTPESSSRPSGSTTQNTNNFDTSQFGSRAQELIQQYDGNPQTVYDDSRYQDLNEDNKALIQQYLNSQTDTSGSGGTGGGSTTDYRDRTGSDYTNTDYRSGSGSTYDYTNTDYGSRTDYTTRTGSTTTTSRTGFTGAITNTFSSITSGATDFFSGFFGR